MASFGDIASRLSQFGVGVAAGANEEEEKLRQENLQLLQTSVELGKVGIDPSKVDLSGIISSNNLTGAQQVADLASKDGIFTKSYIDTSARADRQLTEAERSNKAREAYQDRALTQNQSQFDTTNINQKRQLDLTEKQIEEMSKYRMSTVGLQGAQLAEATRHNKEIERLQQEARDTAKSQYDRQQSIYEDTQGPNRILGEKDRSALIQETALSILSSKAAEVGIDSDKLYKSGKDGKTTLTDEGRTLLSRVQGVLLEEAGKTNRYTDLMGALDAAGQRIQLSPGAGWAKPYVTVTPKGVATTSPAAQASSTYVVGQIGYQAAVDPSVLSDPDKLAGRIADALTTRAKLLNMDPGELANATLDQTLQGLKATRKVDVTKDAVLARLNSPALSASGAFVQRDMKVSFDEELQKLDRLSKRGYGVFDPTTSRYLTDSAEALSTRYPAYSTAQWKAYLYQRQVPPASAGR